MTKIGSIDEIVDVSEEKDPELKKKLKKNHWRERSGYNCIDCTLCRS
jgi:hypothetical protein